jgi:hypothetical protein
MGRPNLERSRTDLQSGPLALDAPRSSNSPIRSNQRGEPERRQAVARRGLARDRSQAGPAGREGQFRSGPRRDLILARDRECGNRAKLARGQTASAVRRVPIDRGRRPFFFDLLPIRAGTRHVQTTSDQIVSPPIGSEEFTGRTLAGIPINRSDVDQAINNCKIAIYHVQTCRI